MIQTWLGFPFIYALFTGVLQWISSDWYEVLIWMGQHVGKNPSYYIPAYVCNGPLLITQFIFNFNNFNIIYLFNAGGPPVRGQSAGGTDILISWIYNLTFSNSQYSMVARYIDYSV